MCKNGEERLQWTASGMEAAWVVVKEKGVVGGWAEEDEVVHV